MTAALLDAVPQRGTLTWIGLRTARRGPVTAVEEAEAVAGLGLRGDHRTRHRTPDPAAKRQVTLIQEEHLAVVASLVRAPVTPEQTRRNLVVRGVNLRSLKGRRFAIGEVVLAASGECHPCSRMEENLGAGGFQAMRGHGGLVALVEVGGTLRRGDPVSALPAPSPA